MGDQVEEARGPLTIRSYPARDEEFATLVADAVAAARRDVVPDDEFAEMVQERLRQVYPSAVARLQQPLARLLDPAGTVYAYRDGAITAADLREDRLAEDAFEPASFEDRSTRDEVPSSTEPAG